MPFRIAVSGLNASQTDLKTIGNNVANSNTTGYKSSRSEFANLFSVGPSGGVKSDAQTGGGVQVSNLRQLHSQGNISFTNNALDLAISGGGYFRLDSDQGVSYTRAGAFGVDNEGFIVNSGGMNLTGYGANDGVISGVLEDLKIPQDDNAPKSTTEVNVVGNLDASVEPINGPLTAPLAMGAEVFDDAGDPFVPPRFQPPDPSSYHNSMSMQVFDSLGAAHNATVYFRKTDNNEWTAELSIDNQAFEVPLEGAGLEFNDLGEIVVPAGPPSGVLSFENVAVDSGAADMNFTLNLNQATQYGSKFGINALDQNGFAPGRLTGVEISEDGFVQASYTNGVVRIVGQVVLANFANPEGLGQANETTWTETAASGQAVIGAPLSASLGSIQASALEESNVELTQELVKLIVAQRNFQANAQVIRAADEVTQTIVNLT